jgi:hypothetical protein
MLSFIMLSFIGSSSSLRQHSLRDSRSGPFLTHYRPEPIRRDYLNANARTGGLSTDPTVRRALSKKLMTSMLPAHQKSAGRFNIDPLIQFSLKINDVIVAATVPDLNRSDLNARQHHKRMACSEIRT